MRAIPMLLIAWLLSVSVHAQPPAGAIPARPNIIYYAGGSCKFHDAAGNLLLSVNAAEAVWSATPAKTAWVVVTPASGGYYEFPNYTSILPACNIPQYLQPFWSSDTVFHELVLLDGVNSTAQLMFQPVKIVSVTNYDQSQTFLPDTDYSVSGRTIKQLSTKVSATVSKVAGKKGNGQPNGLMNTRATSWSCVTYIPDRSDWGGGAMLGYQGDKLPKTMAKLKAGLPVTIQAYGMSITAGSNVSGFAGDDKNFPVTAPYMRGYVELLEEALEDRFGADVTMINGSCGGKTVAWIDAYCESMVVPNNPDLVILDMGMNDIWGNTGNAAFKSHMQSCIDKIRGANSNTEFILVGNMLPDVNGQGAPSNGDVLMYGFLDQLKALEAGGVAVFDMTTLSDTIYARKGAAHCLSNSLHPNDYLARWYAQGLAGLFDDGTPIAKTSRKYFVNTTGNNTDGLSEATAWTSLDQVNARKFNPGDTIVFEAGKTFVGHLEFDQGDGNDPQKPIVLGSYGSGRATIQTTLTTKCGFKATNTQGFHLSDLRFEGPGNGTQKDIDGILFFTDNKAGTLRKVSIRNCEVSGFSHCGIRFYASWDPSVKAGFRDVLIDGCRVHHCRENGIVSIAYDAPGSNFYPHGNFVIRNCEVHDITGYPSASHKGSGIVLSQIDTCLIEGCVAYQNGTANSACGGPGGIWVWSANAVTIQYCESHHNSSGTAGGCDGFGFDLDGGVTNSTIQYCYAHDNDGPGYLLGNFPGARPWGNNTVRYCISANDSRTNNSAVTLFTAPGTIWNGLRLYHNTIYLTPSAKNGYPTFGAFQMTNYGSNMSGVACYNNIFHTEGGLPLVHVPPVFLAQEPRFIGNLYHTGGQPFSITYGTKYGSLAEFRTAGAYCEKNGTNPTGLEADPLLLGLDKAPPTLFPLPTDSLNAFSISDASPARDAGLDLGAAFGIDVGYRDLFGNALTFNGAPDIGAHEWSDSASPIAEEEATEFRIHPNPSRDGYLFIRWPEHAGSHARLMVFDMLGKLCMEKPMVWQGASIDVRSLQHGMYLFQIQTDRMTAASQVVIGD